MARVRVAGIVGKHILNAFACARAHVCACDWAQCVSRRDQTKTGPVGIDLQIYNSRIKTIKDKFLNPSEIKLIKNEEEDLHYFWCAKEAVFKAHGRKKIYLKDHIFIRSINRYKKTIQATLVDGNFKKDYSMNYLKIENYYLVYTTID